MVGSPTQAVSILMSGRGHGLSCRVETVAATRVTIRRGTSLCDCAVRDNCPTDMT